ncbi:MAG: RluA family pseudouridine synthase [Bacteroidia bacterium]|nr:RluA family pseudouridine synthase [Bacteroidia bacterium]MCC6768541.1 RluA family pseudouridine synthase [Bacteroidia bacterium]
MEVLYEDNHLVLVNKTAGEIVQGDKTGDTALSELVAEYIRKKYQKPGDAFIGVIHRLDRPVSGLVAFARTSKALSRMNALFRDRKVEKVYWALVEGKPDASSGTLVHFLHKNEAKNKSFAGKVAGDGLLRCELDFKVLVSTDNYSLLEIRPGSGRHHQIRVQLSSSGWPIRGDVKYGAKRGNDDRSICLHARSLTFQHPVKQEPLCVTAPLPSNAAWKPLAPWPAYFS